MVSFGCDVMCGDPYVFLGSKGGELPRSSEGSE